MIEGVTDNEILLRFSFSSNQRCIAVVVCFQNPGPRGLLGQVLLGVEAVVVLDGELRARERAGAERGGLARLAIDLGYQHVGGVVLGRVGDVHGGSLAARHVHLMDPLIKRIGLAGLGLLYVIGARGDIDYAGVAGGVAGECSHLLGATGVGIDAVGRALERIARVVVGDAGVGARLLELQLALVVEGDEALGTGSVVDQVDRVLEGLGCGSRQILVQIRKESARVDIAVVVEDGLIAPVAERGRRALHTVLAGALREGREGDVLDSEHLAVVQGRAVVPVEVPQALCLRLLETRTRGTVVEDPRHRVSAVFPGLIATTSRIAFGPVGFNGQLCGGRRGIERVTFVRIEADRGRALGGRRVVHVVAAVVHALAAGDRLGRCGICRGRRRHDGEHLARDEHRARTEDRAFLETGADAAEEPDGALLHLSSRSHDCSILSVTGEGTRVSGYIYWHAPPWSNVPPASAP